MGINPVENCEARMREQITQYKILDFENRKRRFPEFVRKEADIFAHIIDAVSIQNITKQDFNNMMNKRNEYLRQLFDCKDICSIF